MRRRAGSEGEHREARGGASLRRFGGAVTVGFAIGLLALFAFGCASAPVPRPHRAVIEGEAGESSLHLLSRILADSCSDDPTDEPLIQRAMLLISSCHMRPVDCVRAACTRLGMDDKPVHHAAVIR